MGLSSQRQRGPGGCFLGSAGHQAILLPSMNSTTWFSRTPPFVNVVLNTSPTRWTRCPGADEARLSLPSQLGWRDGSAISSKIRSALADITRVALTMRSGGSDSMSLSKHVPGERRGWPEAVGARLATRGCRYGPRCFADG